MESHGGEAVLSLLCSESQNAPSQMESENDRGRNVITAEYDIHMVYVYCTDRMIRMLAQRLLSGGNRSGRILNANGNPIEVFVSDGNMEDVTALWNPLSQLLNLPLRGIHGNPGDYVVGNLSTVINQLMQNDSNRVRSLTIESSWVVTIPMQHGTPPAAKEAIEKLPMLAITQVLCRRVHFICCLLICAV